MNTQTHPPYAIPVPNQFQTSQSKEIPQASIQRPSSSTQIHPSELSEHFHTNLPMNNNDKGKSLQLLNDSNSLQLPNFPYEPLLFYLHDHKLYYTSFYGPRYNENAIFMIIKNGTIPLRYLFTVISNLSKLIKRLFKMLTIIRFSSLCPLGILIMSNGSTGSFNIGQLLNLIFSNLF